MRGIKFQYWVAIVDFLYYGEANVYQDDSFLSIVLCDEQLHPIGLSPIASGVSSSAEKEEEDEEKKSEGSRTQSPTTR